MTIALTRITDAAPIFFPVTPFDERGELELGIFREHLGERLTRHPAAIVIAGGAGEFHALSEGEISVIASVAVAEVSGTAPVIVGTGGPLGHAAQIARLAEQSGADGLLVLPPYLIEPAGDGLVRYVEKVAAASSLPLILYHRGTGALTAEAVRKLVRHDRIVGIKDGVGDLDLFAEFMAIAREAGRDMIFFNGLPTAETHQSAYDRLGVRHYSSAVFTMAPEIAAGYREAGSRDALLAQFFAPLLALANETPGHAVSLIKAGLRLGGMRVGSVRPPLQDPSPDQLARLAALLDTGAALAGGQE